MMWILVFEEFDKIFEICYFFLMKYKILWKKIIILKLMYDIKWKRVGGVML